MLKLKVHSVRIPGAMTWALALLLEAIYRPLLGAPHVLTLDRHGALLKVTLPEEKTEFGLTRQLPPITATVAEQSGRTTVRFDPQAGRLVSIEDLVLTSAAAAVKESLDAILNRSTQAAAMRVQSSPAAGFGQGCHNGRDRQRAEGPEGTPVNCP